MGRVRQGCILQRLLGYSQDSETVLNTTGSSGRVLSQESHNELCVLKDNFDCCVENRLKGQRDK